MSALRIGFSWDEYTAQVRGAFLSDLLLLQAEYSDLTVVMTNKDATDLTHVSGVVYELVRDKTKVAVDAWCVYISEEDTKARDVYPGPNVEVQRQNIFVRDLRQERKESQITERVVTPPLRPSNTVRPAPPTANPLNRPPPNRFGTPLFIYGSKHDSNKEIK